ncbi:DUF1264 domain-containing protein [Candidatus Gottesmanbacteria bacterium]|nr:DUF1264 domain-containing protein [Candidatus Gottesmanbacteria bacterium]
MEQNRWMLLVGILVIGTIIGYMVRGGSAASPTTQTQQDSTPIQTQDKPHQGFTLHIDAEKHFPGDEKKIAHHWCKQVSGMYECQLYDSDAKDARLVGVETVVGTDTWKKFDSKEQDLWHYHREEIPKINAKLPDLTSEEAAKVVETLNETYGKVYLLWDPSKSDLPIGQPVITILK